MSQQSLVMRGQAWNSIGVCVCVGGWGGGGRQVRSKMKQKASLDGRTQLCNMQDTAGHNERASLALG